MKSLLITGGTGSFGIMLDEDMIINSVQEDEDEENVNNENIVKPKLLQVNNEDNDCEDLDFNINIDFNKNKNITKDYTQVDVKFKSTFEPSCTAFKSYVSPDAVDAIVTC